MKNLLIFSIAILFVFMLTIPQVYADTYTIKPTSGSGAPGCETRGGCYSPMTLTIESGDSIRFINSDNAAHTITSGTPDGGPDGVFDSGMVMASQMSTHKLTSVGEYPYFCMVHPWMTGLVIVRESGGSTYTPPPTYTPPTSTSPTTSSIDWQNRYLEVLSDFNEVSAKVGELQRENEKLAVQSAQYRIENQDLKAQIIELETTINNLNAVIMEQVKVIYEWVVGN